MNREHLQTVATLLRETNVMSLATCEGGTPWAASVFFVADEPLRLYYISSDDSRHSANTRGNPRAAATINKDHDDWFTIRGLQLEGSVSRVAEDDRERVMGLYLEKFPTIARLRAEPSNDEERIILDRLLKGSFYCLAPDCIRLIDNSVGFGFKVELSL